MLVGTDRELQALTGPSAQIASGGSRLELVSGLGAGKTPVLVVSGVDDAALFQAAARPDRPCHAAAGAAGRQLRAAAGLRHSQPRRRWSAARS